MIQRTPQDANAVQSRKLTRFKVIGWRRVDDSQERQKGPVVVIQAVDARRAAEQYARQHQIKAWELEDGTSKPRVIIRCERA